MNDAQSMLNTSYYVGMNIYLYDLQYALNQVEDSSSYGEYNIITNNCGVRLIQVLNVLGFWVDDALQSFCLDHLQKPEVIMLLRNSSQLHLLFEGQTDHEIEGKDDRELLSSLINYTVSVTQSEANGPRVYFLFVLPSVLHIGRTLLWD
eukprot:TRINITY_DN8744_c0_g1_i1.p1 TRINITY_DN8744_c0_g1~~TRINITY_DN8744_c0_g1_i1.p1  ORF type:complete len:175 (-),score=26.04 TRINITY_DN8744_c0_g1_i1:170-616(-)